MAMSRRAQRRNRGRSHGNPDEPASIRRASGRSGKRRPSDSGYDRDKIDESAEREGIAIDSQGGGEHGFGKDYGQGFGMGAGRGVESSAEGLEGQRLEERDYRGNAGTTFGAPVGPDALKEDTSQDKRPDPKPRA
jgi:hypothetical protein